ncbi:MAG: hypothetical protein K0S48_3132 [Ramlibacter sp.]|nr:hypothetical protein [Ramlibacter sp.]
MRFTPLPRFFTATLVALPRTTFAFFAELAFDTLAFDTLVFDTLALETFALETFAGVRASAAGETLPSVTVISTATMAAPMRVVR